MTADEVLRRIPRPARRLDGAELRIMVEPLSNVPEAEWSAREAIAELELAIREHELGEGLRFETRAEAARHPAGTVPVSLRISIHLLERLQLEGGRLGTTYTALMSELLEAALRRPPGL